MNKIQVGVFGGSGFLGSHVADTLSEKGYQVKIFDLKPSLYLSRGQEMIVGDMTDFDTVNRAIEGCQIVYNFSGLADIDEAKDKPIETTKLNVLGNVLLLEACRMAGVKRFVFASSVYVYSNSGSFYRASKQAAEKFVETFHERYKLPYTILRYGSLYGRRSDRRNGLYRLIMEALSKGTITYDGTPEAMREYIHVKDAAELSVDILSPEFENQHVMLTGSEKMKVKDLVSMIAEMLPKKIETTFTGKTDDGHYEITPFYFNPKIGKKLIKTNHIDLGQGILDTMAEIHVALAHK